MAYFSERITEYMVGNTENINNIMLDARAFSM